MKINFAIRLLTLAQSSAALHSDVAIGADPSLVFFGVQSGSKLDSFSAAILVMSSSEAIVSSFSLFLCSFLLLRYSSRISLFTFLSFLSSVLANVLSTLGLPMHIVTYS